MTWNVSVGKEQVLPRFCFCFCFFPFLSPTEDSCCCWDLVVSSWVLADRHSGPLLFPLTAPLSKPLGISHNLLSFCFSEGYSVFNSDAIIAQHSEILWIFQVTVLNVRGHHLKQSLPVLTSSSLPLVQRLPRCKLCSAGCACAPVLLAGLLYEETQRRRQKVCICPKSNRTARTQGGPSLRNERNFRFLFLSPTSLS